jgi:hypothetical protein
MTPGATVHYSRYSIDLLGKNWNTAYFFPQGQ